MDFVEHLGQSNRERFKRRLVQRSFGKGDPVIDKGDTVSGAYFVLSGALRVFTLSPDGKEATLYRMAAGDTCVLALNSLFNNILYPAWVEADEDTTVGMLPGDVYREMFGEEAVIRDITMRALSSAVFGLMSELEIRHAYTLDQRLASYLLTHADSDAVVHKTQQEIALDIGTTREVVGRLIVQFGSRRLVLSGRGRIGLLDKPGLNAVVTYRIGRPAT
jgi:CRP/FNR family transcriptional regulator